MRAFTGPRHKTISVTTKLASDTSEHFPDPAELSSLTISGILKGMDIG